jgi:hypothetical protein
VPDGDRYPSRNRRHAGPTIGESETWHLNPRPVTPASPHLVQQRQGLGGHRHGPGTLLVHPGLFDDSAPKAGQANYLRFLLSPISGVALAARVKRACKEFVGDQRELYLSEEQPCAEMPYERLLSDAMAGNGAPFTREDAVEAVWAVVDPVLETHPEALPYEPGTWGPTQADMLIAAHGDWHNPTPDEAPT